MEGLYTGDLGRCERGFTPDWKNVVNTIYFDGRKGDYCKRSGKRFTIVEMETAVEKAVTARIRKLNPTPGSSGVEPTVKACCHEANGEFDVFVSGTCDKDVDLKGICVNELPSHLVPSRFHKISAFPITGNGKVDREKLKAMAISRGDRFNNSNWN